MEVNDFLNYVTGVIHVGANTGQERELYSRLGLHVIWIEPIPIIFSRLLENIANIEHQIAFKRLITDKDEEEYDLHISNNSGMSSSIFDLKDHKAIWPDVKYTSVIKMKSITLWSFCLREHINPVHYQALVLDAQGSELLILKGCGSLLHNFKYIKVEVPDFESYEECCQLKDVQEFLTPSYEEIYRKRFAARLNVGNYFDVVYERIDR
jgi:FkbM family methyltransferase